MSDCEQYFIAHDESIKKTQKDIDALWKLVAGLPQDIKYLIESINDLKDRMENKLVTKEICDICHKQAQREIDDLREDFEKLKNYLIVTFVTTCGVLVWELLKMVVSK